MTPGDTSERGSVAFEGSGAFECDACDAPEADACGASQGDACDAFEASGDACDTLLRADDAREIETRPKRSEAGNRGKSRTRSAVAKRPLDRPKGGASGLLDRALSEETTDLGSEDLVSDAGPFDRRLRWIVLAAIAPALEAARTTELRLVSIGLTAIDVETIDESARSLAAMIVDHPCGGALLFRDRGKERGRAHYHGIALVLSTDRIGDHWAEFVGDGGEEPSIKRVRRWRGFCRHPWERLFAEHITRAIQYATKPWPAEYGRRALDRDAIASGAFEGPLRVILRTALGPPGESLVEASPTRRLCLRCEKPLAPNARADARRHPSCRKAASKAKRKVERAAERQSRCEPSEDTR